MKADADALPKPTGVAWAPLVALMPVPGAASLAAFEAKLAETCAGPNVKDDAPRDAAKARRRAGLERLSKATQEGHTILHHVVVNADEVAADALRRSLGAARWHALAEAPANDGRSARRLSRRWAASACRTSSTATKRNTRPKSPRPRRGRRRPRAPRNAMPRGAPLPPGPPRARPSPPAAPRPRPRPPAPRARRSPPRPETAAAAKEDVEVRLKALQKLEASIDATTAWDAEMVGKVDARCRPSAADAWILGWGRRSRVSVRPPPRPGAPPRSKPPRPRGGARAGRVGGARGDFVLMLKSRTPYCAGWGSWPIRLP